MHFKVMRSKQQAVQCGGQQGALGPSVALTAPKPPVFTWPDVGSVLVNPCSTCCSARAMEAPTATQPLFAHRRFSCQADESSVTLTISGLELGDSALYYCSLEGPQ